ncbi:MAG: hypothetical protein BJ554DRAFT_7081, partial [Olpidium bornovanus]
EKLQQACTAAAEPPANTQQKLKRGIGQSGGPNSTFPKRANLGCRPGTTFSSAAIPPEGVSTSERRSCRLLLES